MLNPELRSIYSETVIPALEKMAEYFENKNVEAFVWGVKGQSLNLKAPDFILFDKEDLYEDASYYIAVYAELYENNLSPADSERLGGIWCLSEKEEWSYMKEGSKELWVR